MIKMLAGDRASPTETESQPKLPLDLELVRCCQQGDCNSFRLLYRQYQQRVRSTLYKLCGEQMLDDLVQEVFFRAWKGLPKLKEASYFSTWLYRISWNVASDRRRQLAKNKLQYSPISTSENLSFEDTVSQERDTSDLMRLHYQDLVQRGLNSLSLEHRAVIVLRDLEDIPQKEIAEILNVPLGTVKSRLFHARNYLKKFLIAQGISL